MEDLSLHGVKIGEGVELLIVWIVESSDWKRVKVKQLCVGWVELWKDQMFEGDGNHRLCMEPAIRDHTNKVLRRKRLKYGNSENKILWLLGQYL